MSLNYSGESGAMNEGQADYFACSLSKDYKLGEWAVAKMGKEYLRTLINDLHYPEDIQGEVHADGKIWGALMWDVRTALGSAISDPLIHGSHYYLKSGSPTFLDGYNSMITADENLFAGKYSKKIYEIFKKRGITADAYNGAAMTRQQVVSARKFREAHKE